MRLSEFVQIAQRYLDLSLGAQNVMAGGDGFMAGQKSVAEAIEFLHDIIDHLDTDEDEVLIKDCVRRISRLRDSVRVSNLR